MILIARRTAKAQVRLRIRAVSPEPSLFAHISMEVDEGSDQKSDMWSHLMATHARLKIENTEGDKCYNLKSRLKFNILSDCMNMSIQQ